MKIGRWKKEKCLKILSLKLSEEVAEIGKEITTAQFRKKGLNLQAINEEIEHAELMLAILKKRVNA